MPTIRLPAHDWKPREYQEPAWKALHNDDINRWLLFWHRRGGKDEVGLHKSAMAQFERVGTYWHMLPEAAQARKAIWDAVNPHTGRRRIDECFPPDLWPHRREQDMMLRNVMGSTWQIVGSDNYNSLMGSPPVGVVFSEWALADPKAWAFIRPILAENKGWALFITTPRGKNHAYHMLEKVAKVSDKWFWQVLPATETSVFSPEALQEELEQYIAEHGADDGRALFEQEYLCSFESALIGAYYRHECQKIVKEGRLCRVPVDSGLPVHTAWDLGIADMLSIWFFQIKGTDARLVDYYASAGHGLNHYARILKEKQYTYGTHLLPHDADQRDLGTGKRRIETLKELGVEGKIVPKHNLADGIEATRQLLNRVVVDEERCADGWEGIVNYSREWDDRLKVFRGRPKHDWASHPSDALRTLAMGEYMIDVPGKAFLKTLDYKGMGLNKGIV